MLILFTNVLTKLYFTEYDIKPLIKEGILFKKSNSKNKLPLWFAVLPGHSLSGVESFFQNAFGGIGEMDRIDRNTEVIIQVNSFKACFHMIVFI